jgi:UDP-glucose 4-epimerase
VSVIEGVRRPGDPSILVADSHKATSLLNWRPQFTLEDMISHAWNAYQPEF